MLPLRTYAEILDRLEALRAYLIKVKVKRVPERLDRAIANLKELEEARRVTDSELAFIICRHRPEFSRS